MTGRRNTVENSPTQTYLLAELYPTPRKAPEAFRCAEEDPQLFQPEDMPTLRRAQAICASCPLRGRCLRLGVNRREYGVWGGVLLVDGKPRKRPVRTMTDAELDARYALRRESEASSTEPDDADDAGSGSGRAPGVGAGVGAGIVGRADDAA